MEPTPREQSARNSGGEETGRPPEQQDDHDDDDDDMITGPSYDCVFCKRGFTTAQALGGHMNIHRKDRAKAKPISPSSTTTLLLPPKKPEEKFLNSGFCLSILSYKPPNSAAPEAQIKYQEYILSSAPPPPSPSPSPSPSSAGRESNIDDHLRGAAVEKQKISKEDWRTCLSLQVGSSCGYGSNKEKGKKDDQKKEDELDLELRLGHNP